MDPRLAVVHQIMVVLLFEFQVPSRILPENPQPLVIDHVDQSPARVDEETSYVRELANDLRISRISETQNGNGTGNVWRRLSIGEQSRISHDHLNLSRGERVSVFTRNARTSAIGDVHDCS